MDLLSDNDDDDEEIFEFLQSQKQRRIIERPDHFREFDDDTFQKKFRMSKTSFLLLHSKIEHLIQTKTMRNRALSTFQRILLTLCYYGTGIELVGAGEFCGASKTTCSNVIRDVTVAINTLKDKYIKFPKSGEERSQSTTGFYNIAKFPGIVGAIGCTYIPIKSPGGDEAEIYRDKKENYSLNVQTVCDFNLKILDMVSRWAGSIDDQSIFDHSRIKFRLENNEFEGGLILGHNGYRNERYFVTPLPQVQVTTLSESLYNESLIRTRDVVKRTHAAWKNRFPVLYATMRHEVDVNRSIILATAILHNFCIDENDIYPFDDIDPNPLEIDDIPQRDEVDEEEEDSFGGDSQPDSEDETARRSLIDGHFTRLSLSN